MLRKNITEMNSEWSLSCRVQEIHDENVVRFRKKPQLESSDNKLRSLIFHTYIIVTLMFAWSGGKPIYLIALSMTSLFVGVCLHTDILSYSWSLRIDAYLNLSLSLLSRFLLWHCTRLNTINSLELTENLIIYCYRKNKISLFSPCTDNHQEKKKNSFPLIREITEIELYKLFQCLRWILLIVCMK